MLRRSSTSSNESDEADDNGNDVNVELGEVGLGKAIQENFKNRFAKKQKKGTIDVWWLFDDGGKWVNVPVNKNKTKLLIYYRKIHKPNVKYGLAIHIIILKCFLAFFAVWLIKWDYVSLVYRSHSAAALYLVHKAVLEELSTQSVCSRNKAGRNRQGTETVWSYCHSCSLSLSLSHAICDNVDF